MQFFYSDKYTLPLPEGHRFPIEKYRMLHDFLVTNQILTPEMIFEAPLASVDELLLAHTKQYIEQMRDGLVPIDIMKRIGFPWTQVLYDRSRSTVGGAIGAARAALKDGISGNLAGGTHHAHADRGEGYCVFNDIAVAARLLKSENLANKIAIIDLDVHQGNGNSSIFAEDKDIFILSLHGERNYPFKKVPSTIDVALADGTEDEEYLLKLKSALDLVLNFDPDFIFYQMGVDPLKEDVLGNLNLTLDGLMQRDRMVLSAAHQREIPISLALGGGYAKPIELSVQAYANTYKVVRELWKT